MKFQITIEEMYDNGRGYCLACGEEAWGVEPDARDYQCEICGAHRVCGAEELLLMGALEII